MEDQVVIMTERLSRRFGETQAVDALTLDVHRGEVFGFLGHNGAGKTTTVRLLNGVLAPSEGHARVLGMDPATEGAALRQRTGVLTETPSLDEKLTARENLTIYAELYDVPKTAIPDRVMTLLDDFALADRADELVGGYSRGMKQRLALARTLLHTPALIFLDEPTAGLDPVVTRHVHELIQRLSHQGGRTVFLCTHNLTEAQKLCDRVAVLDHGQLVALGTPRDLGQSLWKGVRLEIELDKAQADAALEAARAVPDVREITWHADTETATAWVPDRERVPALLNALVNAGGRVYRLSPQEPTLEDVYFALHEHRIEEGTRSSPQSSEEIGL
jgi:ABC-2 type transport system ATP-binding protein